MRFVQKVDGEIINLDRVEKIVYEGPWLFSKTGYWRLYSNGEPFTIIEDYDPLFNKIKDMLIKI